MATYQSRHSGACFEAMVKAEVAREAFFAEYPAACQSCDATGLIVSDMDFDTGFIDEAPCSDCLERGRCPVCAGPLTPIAEFTEGDQLEVVGYEEHRPCNHDETTLQAPPSYECMCWVDEADRALDAAQQADVEDGVDFRRHDEALDDLAFDMARDRAATAPLPGRD